MTTSTFGQSPASLSGRATDAMGRPIPNAVVRLVSDPTARLKGRPWRYTLIGDSLGKFSQEGIAPGAYLVMLFTDGKGTDVLKRVSLSAGGAAEVEFRLGGAVPVSGTTLSMAGRGRTSVQTR